MASVFNITWNSTDNMISLINVFESCKKNHLLKFLLRQCTSVLLKYATDKS